MTELLFTGEQLGRLALQFLLAGAGTLSFAILFACPRRTLPYCGLVGAVGWLVYEIAELFGMEAFAASPPGGFDAILMDVMMPEMNGLEATRCIRAFEGKGPDEGTPIIAMTANVFADDVKACLDAGMNSHVGKPLDMKILMAEILKYTNRTRSIC